MTEPTREHLEEFLDLTWTQLVEVVCAPLVCRFGVEGARQRIMEEVERNLDCPEVRDGLRTGIIKP